jgi:hypothetical protein
MAFNLNATVSGLTTISVGIPAAGPTPVRGTLTLPGIQKGDAANSQVVVTVTQTPNMGSPTTIYTGMAGAEGFGFLANCAALDTLAITMSSAALVDQGLNVVKTTISVG